MLFWIIGGLGVIAVAALFLIVFRHWKEIRLLDPESIHDEQVRQKQKQILEQRFERMKTNSIHPIRRVIQRIVLDLKKTFHGWYIKLVRIDRFYKQAKAPFAHVGPSDEDRMKHLLDEARSFVRDEKWADAERRFLEVLSIDQRSTDAYKGLAGLYLKQKMYPQAKETYEFIRKSGKADERVFAGLAKIAEEEGNEKRAQEMYEKAIEIRPRLASRHAELASFHLRRKRPESAWSPALKATELESNSVKFLELALESAVQMNDAARAQTMYDKLRFLQKDRQALQVWKDRMDKIQKP